jgi:uncharacterized protein DUF5004
MKMLNAISQQTSFRKALLLTILTFAGIFMLPTCYAQSIVGKWKGISVKNYYSADYAKQAGKSMEEKTAKEVGNSEIIYNADHTFIMNMSSPNSTEVITMKGVWEATQDQLKLTLEPQFNPKKITTTASFTIHGNMMETTAIISPPSRIIKTVSVATRS